MLTTIYSLYYFLTTIYSLYSFLTTIYSLYYFLTTIYLLYYFLTTIYSLYYLLTTIYSLYYFLTTIYSLYSFLTTIYSLYYFLTTIYLLYYFLTTIYSLYYFLTTIYSHYYSLTTTSPLTTHHKYTFLFAHNLTCLNRSNVSWLKLFLGHSAGETRFHQHQVYSAGGFRKVCTENLISAMFQLHVLQFCIFASPQLFYMRQTQFVTLYGYNNTIFLGSKYTADFLITKTIS